MVHEIELVVQYTIGLMFLFSAVSKLGDPDGFARAITEYDVLPRRVSYYVSFLLIGTEGLLALGHLTGWALTVISPMGICVLICFGVAVGVNLQRGRSLPCYCFGRRGGELISKVTLARIIILAIAESVITVILLSAGRTRLGTLHVASATELGFTLLWTIVCIILGVWLLSIMTLYDVLWNGTDFRNK